MNNYFVEYLNNSLNQNIYFVEYTKNSLNQNNCFVDFCNIWSTIEFTVLKLQTHFLKITHFFYKQLHVA